MKKFKLPLFIIGLIILVVISYSFGYGAGLLGDYLRPSTGYILTNKDADRPEELDFSLFWKTWDLVHEKYEGAIDDKALLEGAISGMVGGLDDPCSMILLPEISEGLLEDLSGSFGGVGVELNMRNGYLTVVSPLEGSPAQKAGLRPKDVILKIDDKETSEMTFDEAIKAIRGKPGTKVKMTVARQGADEFIEVEVTREEITYTNATYTIEDGIAYLRIRQFGEDVIETAKKFAQEVKKNKNIKGVIVDVRDNPGGYFDSSIEISSLFIEDGVIVSEKEKNDKETKYEAEGVAELASYPLIVLINEGSASASEIFAGAIQDYKKGKLIGKKTYGKGSVQSLEELGGGLVLKITIAKWLTPIGRAINGEGIAPDIEVDLSEDDIKADRDPQLDRAKEELDK